MNEWLIIKLNIVDSKWILVLGRLKLPIIFLPDLAWSLVGGYKKFAEF